MHYFREHVRVRLCADGLDECIAHEVPHLREVLGPSNLGTLQEEGHGLGCRHSHTLLDVKEKKSLAYSALAEERLAAAASPELLAKRPVVNITRA